jgi:hypothetical protein
MSVPIGVGTCSSTPPSRMRYFRKMLWDLIKIHLDGYGDRVLLKRKHPLRRGIEDSGVRQSLGAAQRARPTLRRKGVSATEGPYCNITWYGRYYGFDSLRGCG